MTGITYKQKDSEGPGRLVLGILDGKPYGAELAMCPEVSLTPFINRQQRLGNGPWQTPSLADYNALVQTAFASMHLTDELWVELTRSLERIELGAPFEFGMATVVENAGEAGYFVKHDPYTAIERSIRIQPFKEGFLDEHPEDEKALEALLGTDNLSRAVSAWICVNGTTPYVSVAENVWSEQAPYGVTLSEEGIRVSNTINLATGSRLVKLLK